MNILHLRASPFLGSPEKIILGQYKDSLRRKDAYVVAVFDEQPGQGNDFIEGIQSIGGESVPLPPRMYSFFQTLSCIIRLVQNYQVDLICTHDYKSNLFGLLAGLILRRPIVSVFHGRTSHDRKIRIYEWLDDLLLRFFNCVVAVSQDTQLRLERVGVERSKIRVIPNGVEVPGETRSGDEELRRELSIDTRDQIILFAGRLSREKGLFILLDAAAHVVKAFPRALFLIVGDGPEAASLQAQARTLGLERRVRFAGFRKDIQRFFRVMDLAVLPSFTEGMPLLILESYAFGKPVVASCVGGVPEVVEDGVHGLLVEPGNADDLAKALMALLADPVRRDQMGRAAFERVQTHFSVERQASAYAQLFKEVVRSGSDASVSDSPMKDWIWISWERHRRTRELCKALQVRLFERDLHLSRIVKHPYFLFWTTLLMFRHRPGGVIVQNPSVVLAFWAVLMKRIFGYVLVVDAHNEGIRPFSKRLEWLQFIYQFIQRGADLTLVTNERLAKVVRQNGGVPFVLQDKLPTFAEAIPAELKGKHNLVCISTFAKDEPYQEVIEAARGLGPDYVFYFTGNDQKLSPEILKNLPSNVILTGYLPEKAYLSLLKGSDVIIDLTYMEDCLVCGAYEAVALEKPTVLTDTAALKNYFYAGAVYTKNRSLDIKNAVMAAIDNVETLSAEVKVLKEQLGKDWLDKAKVLTKRMNDLIFS